METGQDGSSSVSLEDFAGEAFGDLSVGETPGTPDSGDAAGTPPQSTPPETPEPSHGPEGTTTTERPGTPPVDAAAATPDAGAPPSEDDPFAAATPATYTVDGQERTYAGIKILGEDFGNRGIIEPTDLPDVLRRLGERDHLVDANQVAYRERQAIEPLTSWTITGDDGKEQTLTGQAGLMAMHVDHVRKDALISVMDQVFASPDALIGLLMKDANGAVTIDPAALRNLQREIRLSAGEAAEKAKAQLGSRVAEATKPAPAPIDFTTEAPRLVKQIAGADYVKLTPEDHKFLAAQLPIYTQGKTVHNAFSDLVADRLALRGQIAKVGTTVTDAAKENAAKLAAAARGLKPAAKPAPKPTAQQQHETDRLSDADKGFELLSNLTSRRVAR